MFEKFQIFSIPPYSLLRIVAVFFAFIFVMMKRNSFGIKRSDVIKVMALSIFGAIVGAKVLYVLGQIVMHGRELDFWTGEHWRTILRAGGVLYGSVIGVFVMIFLFCKLFHYKVLDLFALASITLMGVNFFSRLGCLFAGCCYGVHLPSGQQFPYQLAEGCLCALIFFYFVLWKPEIRQKKKIFPLSVILYGVIRFSLEFFRGDASRGVWTLSTSQWISILMIVAALVVFQRDALGIFLKKNSPDP